MRPCILLRLSPARLLAFTGLCLFALFASAPVAAEPATAPLSGHLNKGEWSWYSFPVHQGDVYQFNLSPLQADVDLYLYRSAEQVGASLKGGLDVDSVRWQADRDEDLTAWVYSYAGESNFELAVVRNQTGPAKRVGLQVGHWRNWEASAPFNTNSGSSGGGKTEAEVNLAIARRTAALLEGMGYVVDILPTAMPQGYKADAVVAIHADGGPSDRRGFFTDKPASSVVSEAEARLGKLVDAEYAAATGLQRVFRGTPDSRYYYGYYKVTPQTPMILIETGFLTNAADRGIIVSRPDLAARGIANGIDRFLNR